MRTASVTAMSGADTIVKTNIVRSISVMIDEAGAPDRFMKWMTSHAAGMISSVISTVSDRRCDGRTGATPLAEPIGRIRSVGGLLGLVRVGHRSLVDGRHQTTVTVPLIQPRACITPPNSWYASPQGSSQFQMYSPGSPVMKENVTSWGFG